MRPDFFTPAKSCTHTSPYLTSVLFLSFFRDRAILSAGFGDYGTQGRVP
jgi:hypothetical protein